MLSLLGRLKQYRLKWSAAQTHEEVICLDMHPSVFLYYGDHEHVSNNWSNHNDHESRYLEPYLYVDERTGRTSIGGLWFWCGIGTCVIWHSNLPEIGGKKRKNFNFLANSLIFLSTGLSGRLAYKGKSDRTHFDFMRLPQEGTEP